MIMIFLSFPALVTLPILNALRARCPFQNSFFALALALAPCSRSSAVLGPIKDLLSLNCRITNGAGTLQAQVQIQEYWHGQSDFHSLQYTNSSYTNGNGFEQNQSFLAKTPQGQG